MATVRAAAFQMEHRNGDKAFNFEKLRALSRRAVADGAAILCFPECCLTGYWGLRDLPSDAFFALAEPVFDGPLSRDLAALAAELEVTIGAGLLEVDPSGKLFNTYVVSFADGRQYRHRKLHAFLHEDLESGTDYTVFDSPHGCRLGVLTCYDNNINENCRATALLGAEVLLAPHQTGGVHSENPHLMGRVDRRLWDARHEDPAAIEREFAGDKGRAWLLRWLPSRAHDNGMYVLFSNGVGPDDDEVRTGNAMILDPFGSIVAETGVADDAHVVADLDLALLDPKINTGRRWMQTRRPELYDVIARRIGIEVDTRDSRMSPDGF